MIDKTLVFDRLDRLGRYINELEKLRDLGREAFLSESRNIAAAESFLRRALESVFDVGRHVLARTGGAELATEYKAIALGLGERQIVPKELADRLVLLAGYRNRLVHLYHLVSNEELWRTVESDLGDLRRFINAMLIYVNS